MINIRSLIDDGKCYSVIRDLRWPNGIVACVLCHSTCVKKDGHDRTEPHRQNYLCNTCKHHFHDLSGTILAGHHKPLSTWVSCLYLMGLNISNRQIAYELDLSETDAQYMTSCLRQGVNERKPEPQLSGTVECDEVYIVAGHKGHPEVIKKQGREGRRNRLRGARGRGTLEKEKPPIFGMIQRKGAVVIRMLPNVKKLTIKPLIDKFIAPETLVNTDEYSIYGDLPAWGYQHKSVCHSREEYARDEDGDGFCEVHVNTMEGFWSLLRSWLRPHRGISQEKLPLYLSFFEFVHNAKLRGKGVLQPLLELMVMEPAKTG